MGEMTSSRRAVLTGAVVAGATALSAKAAAPATHPVPGVEFAFEAIVDIAPSQTPGATPYGKRNRIPITGGTFEGPRIKGKVLPGGADWQLTRADNVTTLDADYMIEADDGTLIHVHNHAIVAGTPGSPDYYLRTSPVFEVPIGKHDWLNKAIFVGTVEMIPSRPNQAVCIRVFKVI